MFCQFHGIPQRDPGAEPTMQTHVRADLGKRWVDYFTETDDFILDRTHLSFKLAQIAFRDCFDKAP
eukprot:15122017-Alexandrium_andersonii.AAC.1